MGSHFQPGSPPKTPINSATLWRSCCLKTTIVVFVTENCWFYQHPQKTGVTKENIIFWEGWGRNFDRKKISRLKIGFVNSIWTLRRNYNVERSKEGSKDGNHAAFYFWFSTFPLTDFCKNPIDAATNRHIGKNLTRSTSFSFLVEKHSFCVIVSYLLTFLVDLTSGTYCS